MTKFERLNITNPMKRDPVTDHGTDVKMINTETWRVRTKICRVALYQARPDPSIDLYNTSVA